MSRPCKSVSTTVKNFTKDEMNGRLESEEALKGNKDKLVPSDRLTDDQKEIFDYIITELENAGILGNLDLFVLETACISIDRVRKIEQQINENFDLVCDTKIMGARDKYSKDFFRCCNELSLSPQSRAKMALYQTKKDKEDKDPLLKLLK